MLNWTLNHWRAEAGRVLRVAQSLHAQGDVDLRRSAQELAWRVRTGEPLKSLVRPVYAHAIEACRRQLGLTHFPVQVMGGLAMFRGCIAEMQTGEGKTLTAVLAATLRAMAGKGCHVLTANDYLARRDAELLGPVYARLGLTTGCIYDQMEDDDRRTNYARDITYGTASQIGFDFLRDRLKRGPEAGDDPAWPQFSTDGSGERPVQRGFHFALIDEADSILIDDARTPLIIGLQQSNRPAMLSLYHWASRIVPQLHSGDDFVFHAQKRHAQLTEAGCRRLNLTAKPLLMDSLDTERIFEHVEKALTAKYAFARDRDYVIVEDKVSIIDEGTGRVMEGRQWQEGLHQAIESKERLPISPITGSAARISVQMLFRLYPHLAGMTGTALTARAELKRMYRLDVRRIPTNRPCIREGFDPRVFTTLAAKWNAVAAEVLRQTASGRAVLIGTPSVDASEGLSRILTARGISHQVLNAHHHVREAAIVTEAGRQGAVTIATNMAGRGTDIHLGDVVRAAGGLHVIATELHSSTRIDRQLVGRSARQGDPGSFQFFLSLEDELLRVVEPGQRTAWQRRARGSSDGELSPTWAKVFRTTQRRLERMHIKQRREMLKHQREQLKRARQIGLDPYLEAAED